MRYFDRHSRLFQPKKDGCACRNILNSQTLCNTYKKYEFHFLVDCYIVSWLKLCGRRLQQLLIIIILSYVAGQIIYPGKLTNANCFRIGNIGDLYPSDMKHLLKCIAKVLDAMGVPIPVPVPSPGS